MQYTASCKVKNVLCKKVSGKKIIFVLLRDRHHMFGGFPGVTRGATSCCICEGCICKRSQRKLRWRKRVWFVIGVAAIQTVLPDRLD